MALEERTMLTVLIYDITNDRNRTRLHKLLKRYAVPIQKSAFEGKLTRSERDSLLRMVDKYVDRKSDRFVMYTVASPQEKNIEVLGTPRPQHSVQSFFIV